MFANKTDVNGCMDEEEILEVSSLSNAAGWQSGNDETRPGSSIEGDPHTQMAHPALQRRHRRQSPRGPRLGRRRCQKAALSVLRSGANGRSGIAHGCWRRGRSIVPCSGQTGLHDILLLGPLPGRDRWRRRLGRRYLEGSVVDGTWDEDASRLGGGLPRTVSQKVSDAPVSRENASARRVNRESNMGRRALLTSGRSLLVGAPYAVVESRVENRPGRRASKGIAAMISGRERG